jgi:hypothetical protein
MALPVTLSNVAFPGATYYGGPFRSDFAPYTTGAGGNIPLNQSLVFGKSTTNQKEADSFASTGICIDRHGDDHRGVVQVSEDGQPDR